jgi:hypothetical protein
MENISCLTSNSTRNQSNKLYTQTEVVVLTILFCIALIGHSLILIKLIFYNKKHPLFNSNSQHRMSFYLINLSLADISVALMSILPQIIWRYHVVFWSQSDFVCKTTVFIQLVPIYASTIILIIMSHDRYVHLNKPRSCQNWSCKKAMIKISLAWFVAILISSPQLFLYKIIQVPFNATTNVSTCYVDWNSFSLSINWELIYIMYHLILQYFLPIILLIYYFTRIFLNVSPNRRKRTKETIDLIFKKSNSEYSNESNPKQLRRSFSESRLKTSKLTFTIVLTFILCGLPFYSFTFINVIFRESLKCIDLKGINIGIYLFIYLYQIIFYFKEI